MGFVRAGGGVATALSKFVLVSALLQLSVVREAKAFFAGAQPPSPPPIYRVCANNLRTKFWAQLSVDADLMLEEMARMKVPEGHTNVAVIDTGFDRQSNESRLARPLLKLAKGAPDAGEPHEDKEGHGTMVAGVIGGAGNIGVAPDVNLSVYRVTSNLSDSIKSKILSEAIRTVCQDGNEVINVSWGNVRDEMGEARDENGDKKLMAELTQKGCLVTKAAGNSAYRLNYESDDLDDIYLRAGATNDVSQLSSFSTRGEVSAPGSFVFTLESEFPGHKSEKDSDKRCDGEKGRFVNGTSFAAPITAAVAGEVFGVLKTVGPLRYAQLLPRDRVLLVNRILKASEFLNSINGLRAVLIAERWAQDDGLAYVSSVTELAALLDNQPPAFCQAPVVPWKKGEDLNRLPERRRRLAVCPESFESKKNNIAKIIETYVIWGDLEQAVRWLRSIDQTYIDRYSVYFKKVVDRLWDSQIRKWQKRGSRSEKGPSVFDAEVQLDFDLKFGMDFDEALAILPYYLMTRNRGPIAEREIEKAIAMFIKAYDSTNRLSRRNLRGSEEDFERLGEVWKIAAAKTSPARLIELLAKWAVEVTAYENEWSRTDGRKLLSIYRVIDSIAQTPEMAPAFPKAFALEFDIFNRVNRTNKVTLERAAQENPKSQDLVHHEDLNDYYVPFLDSFFTRHKQRVLEQVGLSSGKFDPGALNSFFLVHLLVSEKTGLDPTQRESLYLKTLEAVAEGRGWNDVSSDSWIGHFREDDKLTRYARAGLVKLTRENPDPAYRERIATEYNRLFENSTNLSFYVSEFPFCYRDPSLQKLAWKLISDENPLISKRALARASARILMGIPKQSKSWKFREAGLIATVADKAVPFLMRAQPEYFAQSLSFPKFGDGDTNRLRPRTDPVIDLGMKPATSEILGTFVGDWGNFLLALEGDERKNFHVGKPLYAMRWDREGCKSLPGDGDWKAIITKVRANLEGAQMETHGSNVYENRFTMDGLLKDCGETVAVTKK